MSCETEHGHSEHFGRFEAKMDDGHFSLVSTEVNDSDDERTQSRGETQQANLNRGVYGANITRRL